MQGTTTTAALLGALAILGAAFWVLPPAPASAQMSRTCGHPSQQEPTGLLGPVEAREVARALDEAERATGRKIYVDVVVDEGGRRVSTAWRIHLPHEGAGYATEIPRPVPAEDVNATGGIAVLVDPFEGMGSFVEASSLSHPDERYLSALMTSEFRRGSYEDGLIAVAHGLEDRLAHPRPLPLPLHPLYREPPPRRHVSGAAAALFTGGIVAVVGLLGYFLRGERYRGTRGAEKGVGFAVGRRDAMILLSALAPRVMLLTQKEMAVVGLLGKTGGEMSNESRRGRAEGLLRQAVSGGFWKSFVAATALVEEDPEEALPELHRLSTEVEAALGKLSEAERALCDLWADEGPGGEGHLTRRDESDA